MARVRSRPVQIGYVAADAQGAGALAEEVARLLAEEPELPYAGFLPLVGKPGAAVALQAGRMLQTRGAAGWLVARDASGACACLRLEDRAFDSAHFGLRMAAIERPAAVADPERRAQALDALYPAAFAWLREAGYAHVAARAFAGDPVTGWCLQAAGAFHVGTSVHWMCPLDGRPAQPDPAPIVLEARDREGLRALEAPAWKRLVEWSGRAFHRGPFPFDPTLPRERSLLLYQAWMEKIASAEWADGAMLALDGGEVVAVIPMQLLADVSAASGARVYGRSLAATLPEYQGLCTALMRAMIARRPFGAEWMEGDTPVTTFGTINMFAKVGFRYLRAGSVFHRRLDRR
jgi:hypothetical protein